MYVNMVLIIKLKTIEVTAENLKTLKQPQYFYNYTYLNNTN